MTISQVILNGSFRGTAGGAATGAVTFTLSAPISDAAGTVVSTDTVICPLVAGAFTTILFATDDSTTQPQGATYLVTFEVNGLVWQRTFALPHATSPVDISTLVPAVAGTVSFTYALKSDVTSAVAIEATARTAADALRVPALTSQSAERAEALVYTVAPFTAGTAGFRVAQNSYPNTDSTFNHAMFIGWNPSTVSPHGSFIAGKPAWTIGMEDNFYDSAGDLQHGPEFYVEYASADGTVSLLRPFYARGSHETGTDRMNIQFDVGTDTNGVFSVFAGKTNPVLFTVHSTLAEATVPVLITGQTITFAPASGQAILAINSTNPVIQYQIAGAQAWDIIAEGINNLSFLDKNSRSHIALTQGATTAAAVTDIQSSLKVEGNVGFYATAPVAKQTLTGAKGGNAALASVIAALVALGLVTDTTTA